MPDNPAPRRRRPPPRPVEVVSTAKVTPRLVSVTVAGDGLEAFCDAAPTSHLKLLLPREGQDAPTLPAAGPDGLVWPSDDERPVVRTYTPRRYDEATGTLEVQFVLHGTGPASAWAERAQPGHRLGIAGPGGRFQLDPDVGHWWIAGDESALPAVGTLLDALPATARADVHLEVDGPDDELALPSAATTTITWHHRQPGAWGAHLEAALSAARLGDDTRVWVASEAVAVRRIRHRLLGDLGRTPATVTTRGYWRAGEANHPDHDYGED